MPAQSSSDVGRPASTGRRLGSLDYLIVASLGAAPRKPTGGVGRLSPCHGASQPRRHGVGDLSPPSSRRALCARCDSLLEFKSRMDRNVPRKADKFWSLQERRAQRMPVVGATVAFRQRPQSDPSVSWSHPAIGGCPPIGDVAARVRFVLEVLRRQLGQDRSPSFTALGGALCEGLRRGARACGTCACRRDDRAARRGPRGTDWARTSRRAASSRRPRSRNRDADRARPHRPWRRPARMSRRCAAGRSAG